MQFILTLLIIIFVAFSVVYNMSQAISTPECIMSRDIGMCKQIVELRKGNK